MAVTQVRGGQRFHCLKADTKPTTGVPTGSQLFETDTGGKWEYNGAAWVPVGPIVEAITLAQPTIDYGHHEIHGGSSFTVQYSRTTDATAGHRSGIYLLTPATPLLHMVVSFSSSIAAVFSICEGVTFTANIGTHGVAIYNRYRDSVKVSGVFDNATTAAANKVTTIDETEFGNGSFNAGTVIRTEPLEAGTGPKPAGGASRDSEEYILAASTKYIFMITNTPATANVHHILLDWYEHTNR